MVKYWNIKGKCAYVLRQHISDYKFELWDPKYGEPYFYDIKKFVTKFLFIEIS